MKDEIMADPEVRRVYEEELLFGEATENLTGLIRSLGLTQKEVARRLGVSEGRVSQILSGGENLTLRSLGAVGWALGVRFELTPHPMNQQEKRGTPAESDPPAPEWVVRLQPVARIHRAPVPAPAWKWGKETDRPAPAKKFRGISSKRLAA